MVEYRLAVTAEAEIRRILDRSEERFGNIGRARYAALIVAAMEDVAGNRHQALVDWRRLSRIEIGVYRIAHSRDRVPEPSGRVGDPKHAIVFRVAQDGVIDIIGIIHDRMLLTRALRKILRSDPGDA
ncbi:MAG: type II toxin-antitoxin system RelE/ParE family toxin [Aliidongia sp.]